MPLMADVRAVTVFRIFGGYQPVVASNTVYSKSGTASYCKGGAAIGYHRRHGNLLDTDPRQTNEPGVEITGESYLVLQVNFYTAPH
jgi:hypothetical protein